MRENGGSVRRGGSKRWLGKASECSVRRYVGRGKGAALGIRKARRGQGSREVVESGAESKWYRYYGTETGEAWVGE